jgi:hypothetical protein
LNLKSTLQDSLVELLPIPSQVEQIISPDPVHLAQSASLMLDNKEGLIGFFRSHSRHSIVPTPSSLGQVAYFSTRTSNIFMSVIDDRH